MLHLSSCQDNAEVICSALSSVTLAPGTCEEAGFLVSSEQFLLRGGAELQVKAGGNLQGVLALVTVVNGQIRSMLVM